MWATKGGRLHRKALEHIRPVTSEEARQVHSEEMEIPAHNNPRDVPDVSLPEAIPPNNPGGPIEIPNDNPEINDGNSSQSQDQPDTEPDGNNSDEPEQPNEVPNYIDTPIPSLDADDELVTTHLLCCDDEVLMVDPMETPCAWRFEVDLPSPAQREALESASADEILLAATEKKQRTEVKLSMLSPEEKVAFQEAKRTEIKNWLATGTVSKILKSKLAPEQILTCRWLLVWKDKEETTKDENSRENLLKPKSKLLTHKPKARLVVLGYLDPNLTEIPRDSPTLGRQSKMILLQLIASYGWSLASFDIKAAFLQGKTQNDRVMGLDPVPELAEAMQLRPGEICKLDKSAYGLIDAPYLWFKTLCEELTQLGMQSSPLIRVCSSSKTPKPENLREHWASMLMTGSMEGTNTFTNKSGN